MEQQETVAISSDVPPPGLSTCPVCERSTPFTAAILAGLPLGQICTCAIEQRALERSMMHANRRSAQGH